MQHLHALLRTAVRLCRHQHLAEDLVQETMLRAWKAFDRYQPQTNCKAWLLAILMNLWTEEHRKPRSRNEVPEEVGNAPQLRSASGMADDRVYVREVLACIDELPEEQRGVLLLSVVEGFSLREVSEILQTPMGTVMSRLGRARAALRARLFARPPIAAAAEGTVCDAMKQKRF
ncbi:MAG: RNA polymerase sigma factor [Terriglobales bacterium]